MEQLPLAGILAPAMDTALEELVNVPDAPVQVVVGAGEVCTVRLAGTVSMKLDWVKSKPLALLNVKVTVAVSVLAAESVTVRVSVPAAPLGTTVTCDSLAGP